MADLQGDNRMTYQQLFTAMERAKDLYTNLHRHIEFLGQISSEAQRSTIKSAIDYYRMELEKEIEE
jgi:LPS O-antigen subunit length determinant protein (WzzB/FepE family)